jgi:maleylpyruvate isomerase
MGDMTVPPSRLAAVRQSTDRLVSDIRTLTDDRMREPSLLSGWSRGHVVGHLAAHARSLLRVTDGAERGDLVDPYPGGAAARSREIEEWATRPAAELTAELTEAVAELDRRWTGLAADVWQRPTRSSGGERPLAAGVLSRWTEVEVHRVDLGLGYGPAGWPGDYVSAALPGVVTGLPRRAAGPPAETWLVRATDTGESWLVDATGDPKVVPGDAPAAHVVAAGQRELLAWLLGRTPGEPGWTRDPSALDLPRWFPYP